MARKKKHEDHVNHEAWAIPYADLMTLLLAFFVVMYAVSSVNEGKFRVLSESIVAAFRGVPMVPDPIQIGQPATTIIATEGEPARKTSLFEFQSSGLLAELGAVDRMWEGIFGDDLDAGALAEIAEGMSRIADEIQEAMGALIDADMIRVRRDLFWLEVEINTAILFASGSSELYPAARPILEKLGSILKEFNVRVHVEGFTDTMPISTQVFPSNWELSAGRAATVVRLLAQQGLDPVRMAAIGFGEFRPIADNATAEGRQENRRVTVVVLADRSIRFQDAAGSELLRSDIDRRPAQPVTGGAP